MNDPLSDIIDLLKPNAVYSKRISGTGAWAVKYSAFEQPSFCVVLEGRCRLTVDGQETIVLEPGDFILLPATPGFILSGFKPAKPILIDAKASTRTTGEVRHGTREVRRGSRGSRPDVRLLGGYFGFESSDTDLLVSLLPPVVHVRGSERLALLVQLVADESKEQRAGRELVLQRLVEVMLIEALRAAPGDDAPPGLLHGLADKQLAIALRLMHNDISRSWTVAQLAQKSALSRSSFFNRFTAAVGVPPMEYLLDWRMNVAKDMLRYQNLGVAEVADRVGYGSASTFSTAFTRHVGQPPSRYARD